MVGKFKKRKKKTIPAQQKLLKENRVRGAMGKQIKQVLSAIQDLCLTLHMVLPTKQNTTKLHVNSTESLLTSRWNITPRFK